MQTPESMVAHTTAICMTRFVDPEWLTGRVLDVGCGAKPYKRLAAKTAEWIGLDKRPVGEVLHDVNAGPLPFEDESFDTVILTDVLHQCPSPLITMKECARVLKPGGHLIVSVPNTCADTESALWGIRKKGLFFLITAAGLDTEGVMATGRIFNISWDNVFSGAGQEVSGWLDKMSSLYPIISFAVCEKGPALDGDYRPEPAG